jgi:hypothetical protein
MIVMVPYHPQSIANAPFNSLQHLGFQRFMPHPRLHPWVQCYWIAQRDQPSNQSLSETVYPDAGSSLGLDFPGSELPDIRFNATKTAGKMVFTGSIHRIGIRFHPGGAFQLLGVEMSALDQDEFSADALALPDIEQLQYQLAEASEISRRLTLKNHRINPQPISP